jgi:pyruvate dehydrogenase E1 component alpha subunit
MEQRYSNEELLTMYDKLKTARVFAKKMEQSVYDGLCRSSYHTPLGQEATSVAITTAVKDTDWLGYTHRGQLILIDRYGLQPVISEVFGFVDGAGKGSTFDYHLGDYTEDGPRVISMPGTLGSAIPQHVGFAFAKKLQGKDEVVVAVHGDGGCSEGTVYEAWNLAALYKPPIVFVIENNGWGMTVPLERQSANPNISEKAGACGLPYTIVEDGTDILAVRKALDEAVAKARNNEPQVVEVKNLRWGPHFVGYFDDYRDDKEEVQAAMKSKGPKGDCVARYEEYLLDLGLIDQAYIDKKTEEASKEVEECYANAAKSTLPKYEDIYSKENIYATPETGGDL